MLKIVPFEDKFSDQYCDLYIKTWKEEPYGELFTKEEVGNHLEYNLGYLYLLLHDDNVIGFIGGRPLTKNCSFFDNQASTPIDLESGFYIDELGLDIPNRNHGWGRILTSFLISAARQDGYSEFVLRTHSIESNPALGLYQRLGMQTRTTNNGEIHQVLTEQKRIDNRAAGDSRIYFYKTYGR